MVRSRKSISFVKEKVHAAIRDPYKINLLPRVSCHGCSSIGMDPPFEGSEKVFHVPLVVEYHAMTFDCPWSVMTEISPMRHVK